MKAAVWTSPGQIELRDIPAPEIRSGEALVRVEGCGICGSDLHIWQGHSPNRNPPLILGHEIVGEVVSVSESDHLRAGDLVCIYPPLGCETCNYCLQGREALCRHKRPRGINAAGGFAEYVAMPVRNLLRMQATDSRRVTSVFFKSAALVEPLATALHFVNAAKNDRGPAAILGVGPIGLMILQVARQKRFSKIAVLEKNPHRLNKAREFGASMLVSPSSEGAARQLADFFGEDGCHVVWDTAGVAATRSLALRLVRSGGLVVELGLAQAETPFDFDQLIRREIRVMGSYAYSRSEFSKSAYVLQRGAIGTNDWVTDAPLDDIQSVFQDLTQPDTSLLKVVLQP